MASIAPPENLQTQSPLLQLPPEIKHIIFGLCFVADTPITDPQIDCKSKDGRSEPVGDVASRVSLLQTCRRMYHEVDRRPLFAQNTFRFSSLETMRTFFQALPPDYRTRIQDVEVDLRQLNSDRPQLTREWLQYLAWTKDEAKTSLRTETGGLKCIRINLEAWPVVAMYRCELWNVLREILKGFADVESVVVTGTSRGKTMAQTAPWSPVHFVGGDNVGSNDLLSRMSNCVVAKHGEDKMIKWLRKDRKFHLEVVSTCHAGGISGAAWAGSGAWPLDGFCTFSAYEQCQLDGKAQLDMSLNPNVVG